MTQAWILLGVMLTMVLAVAIIAIFYNLRVASQVIEQFTVLGKHFDLELTVPVRTMAGLYQRNPSLYGYCQGREMSIYPRGYGMDNTRQTDVAVRMLVRTPKDLRFSLARKNLPGKLGQLGRMKEITTGNDAFDKAFTLRSKHPAVAAIFDQEMRERILEDWQAPSGFLSLQDKALAYEEMGLPRTEAARHQLENMVDMCFELAVRLEAWTQ